MKKRMMSLLLELLKDSKRSDGEIAKVLGVSQPTITRTRQRLVKEGVIKEFTVIPDFVRMGYEIFAFTFLAFSEASPKLIEEAREWTKKQPSIIFAADGEGLGMNTIVVSVHKNYASFSRLITNLRHEWQPKIRDIQSFIFSVNRPELLVKSLSLKSLAESEET